MFLLCESTHRPYLETPAIVGRQILLLIQERGPSGAVVDITGVFLLSLNLLIDSILQIVSERLMRGWVSASLPELTVSCCVFPGGNKMYPLTTWRELITPKASLMSHLIFSSFWKDVRDRQRYYDENKWSESRHGSLEEKSLLRQYTPNAAVPAHRPPHTQHTHKVLGGVRDRLKITMSKNQKGKYLWPMWSNYSTRKVKSTREEHKIPATQNQ